MKLGTCPVEVCETLCLDMMGESAQQAFFNGNYEQAAEIYERSIKENGASVDLLLGLADSLINCGKVHEALNVYSRVYNYGLPHIDRLETLVESVANIARQNISDRLMCTNDVYSCNVCHSIIIDPVTLTCGHTFCKRCIVSDSQSNTCKKCGKTYTRLQLAQLKTNVAISTLLEKWWSNEVTATKHRLEGNAQYQNGNNAAAVESYSLALELDPSNYLAASNRSQAFLTAGQAQAAFQDAEAVVRLCPSWPKGYFRKATALVSLGRYEEAAAAYLHCVVFDPNAISAKNEAKKLIHKLFLRHQSVNHDYLKQSNTVSNAFCTNPLHQQRQLTGSEGSLYSGDSTDGCWVIGDVDSESSSDDETVKIWNSSEKRNVMQELDRLHKMLDKFFQEVEINKSMDTTPNKRIDPSLIDRCDFECPLCMRIFWEPVTTPCGHTFCRMCLDRCFDHQPTCPLCKTSLSNYLAERGHCATEFIEVAMQTLLPDDYAERKKVYEEEMEELASAGKDPEHVIPLFICTTAYPTVPCPLHVFEPRYRLMIRQCMQSGTRQFGMCAYVGDQELSIADYGTMVEIRDVQYFPDGRSVVDTIGSKRFRILSRGMRDGYHTGAVEFLQDNSPEGQEIEETRELHNRVRQFAEIWFRNLPEETKRRILQHFGPMPAVETDYVTSPNGPSWVWWLLAVLPLDTRAQLAVLAMTSLQRRLESLHRVLIYLQLHNPI